MREPVSVVVGRNCRAIRTRIGITQEQMVRYAREAGLRWTASKLGDFERGRREVSLGTALAVSHALARAHADAEKRGGAPGKTPLLADLLRFEGNVVCSPDGPDPLGAVLAAVCSGQPWPHDQSDLLGAEDAAVQAVHDRVVGLALSRAIVDGRLDPDLSAAELAELRHRSALTEDRVAQRLGISRDRLAAESFRLWRSTFSEERDRRAGADANQQQRGRIARELRAELEKALADGDD